jgi:hypothetical protein
MLSYVQQMIFTKENKKGREVLGARLYSDFFFISPLQQFFSSL